MPLLIFVILTNLYICTLGYTQNHDLQPKCIIGEVLENAIPKSGNMRTENTAISRPAIAGMRTYQSSNGIFVFHYITEPTSPHAIAATATRFANIPDYVLDMSETFVKVYDEYQKLGYARPPSDGSAGGTSGYDVYLINIEVYLNRNTANRSIYGLCVPEQIIGDNPLSSAREIGSTTSWMAMQNTYSWVRNSRIPTADIIRVTAAHEFFHAIQFGYSYQKQADLYFIEGTAVSMEEQFFPKIEDYFQYLSSLYRNINGVSLFVDGTTDTRFSFNHYAVWLYFKKLREIYGDNIIREILEPFRFTDTKAINSIKTVLQDKGSSFEQSLRDFALANALQFDYFFSAPQTFTRARDYYNYYTNNCLSRSNASILCPTFSIFNEFNYGSSPLTLRYGQQLDTLWMPASADYYKLNIDTTQHSEFRVTITPYQPERWSQMSAFMLLNTADNFTFLQSDNTSRYYHTFHIKNISAYTDYTLVVLRHDADAVNLASMGYQIHIGKDVLGEKTTTHSESVIEIYPNPVTDYVHITHYQPITKIALYDLQGVLWNEFNFTPTNFTEIDVAHLPKGVYLVYLQSQDQTIIKRFVKI